MHKEKHKTNNIIKALARETKENVWGKFVTEVVGFENFTKVLAVASTDEQKMCRSHNTKFLNFVNHSN